MSKIHPQDWRNFRDKKHWFGIHHHTKKIRKEYCSTTKDDIDMSLGCDWVYPTVPSGRRKRMRIKARYQTWEWCTNNM